MWASTFLPTETSALGVVVVAVVGLLTTWLLLLLLIIVARPQGFDLREAKRFVPDVVRLVRAISKDPATSRSVRLRLLLLVAYLASPIDLVPDFIPLIGYADDVIIVAIALRSIVRHAGPEVLDQHWRGTSTGLAIVKRLAGVAPSVIPTDENGK